LNRVFTLQKVFLKGKKPSKATPIHSTVFTKEDGVLVYGKRKTNPFCASFLGFNPNVFMWFFKLAKAFLKERNHRKQHQSIQQSLPKKMRFLFMGKEKPIPSAHLSSA